MAIEVRPATVFDDVRALVGQKRADARVCWCLSHRIPAKRNAELRGTARGDYVRTLVEAEVPPGVLAYDGDEPVGWAGVAPRAQTQFARSRKIPTIDDLDVWTVWCVRVRPGHRGEGIAHRLLAGAVDFARDHGAPAIEGYPADNGSERVDLTMAFVGTVALFEAAGFHRAAETDSVAGGFPRVLMRRALRPKRP